MPSFSWFILLLLTMTPSATAVDSPSIKKVYLIRHAESEENVRIASFSRITESLFSDNVAHSNRDQGMRLYPSGFYPDEQAVFRNSRFYRNRDGIFIHKCRNVSLVGGVYADSRVQIDIDRADDIEIRDLVVIGTSEEYQSVVDTQGAPSVCDLYGHLNRGRSNIGIQLHTFVNEVEGNGAVIRNVTFTGFVNDDCDKVAAIGFDDEIREGTFDYFTTVCEVQTDQSTVTVDFCAAEAANVSSLYLVDLDSSLHQDGSFVGTSTFVAGNNPFALNDGCLATPDRCHFYCEDTCLRTVTYSIDPANTEDVKVKVCGVDSDICAQLEGRYWHYEDETELKTLMRNTQSDRLRYFAIALPKGSYTASFLDNDGEIVWPSFVHENYEDVLCSEALVEGSIAVAVPELEDVECDDLIRNGNAEASDSQPLFWLHRKGGIVLNITHGRNGGHAFSDVERSNAKLDSIAQYLDTRCLAANRGSKYEINAWVKLVDPETGESYVCDDDIESCPEVGIVAYSPKAKSWRKEPVASMDRSDTVDDYQFVRGELEINEEMSTASSVLFYVERNRVDLMMLVDDVSMKRIDASAGTLYDDKNGPSVVAEASTSGCRESRTGMAPLILASALVASMVAL